ncbi:MAG: hypothetical protein H6R00_240 [Proteobacteria bacterium]|nr:hypothetical protein [Pseudomonadota bacterium]
MMAAIKIDSPLMSRNLVEIFDIIESISAELGDQQRAIGELADIVTRQGESINIKKFNELVIFIMGSSRYCTDMIS